MKLADKYLTESPRDDVLSRLDMMKDIIVDIRKVIAKTRNDDPMYWKDLYKTLGGILPSFNTVRVKIGQKRSAKLL